MNVDPLKYGRNWYLYGLNNPVNLIDPGGTVPWLVLAYTTYKIVTLAACALLTLYTIWLIINCFNQETQFHEAVVEACRRGKVSDEYCYRMGRLMLNSCFGILEPLFIACALAIFAVLLGFTSISRLAAVPISVELSIEYEDTDYTQTYDSYPVGWKG